MSDANELWRQGVQQKPTQKFLGAEGHDFDFVAMGVIAPAKTHLLAVETHEPVIGNGHPVCIAAGSECADLSALEPWR